MKKLIVFIFILLATSICISFFSCGREDEETDVIGTIPIDSTQAAELRLTASQLEVSLFEMTEFNLYARGFEATYLDYDSIIWKIDNLPFYNKSAAPQYLISKRQSFIHSGDYETIIWGYKEGQIASGDTVKIKVRPKADFLGIYWSNVGTPGSFYNYIDYDDDYILDLLYNRRDMQYALLSYKILTYVDENDLKERNLKSRQLLTDYIKSLYGNTAFEYNGNDITQSPLETEYYKRFEVPLGQIDLTFTPEAGYMYIPLVIWDTPASHIALLGTVGIVDTDPENPDPNPQPLTVTYFKVIGAPRAF